MEKNEYFEQEAMKLMVNAMEYKNPGMKLRDMIAKLFEEIYWQKKKNGNNGQVWKQGSKNGDRNIFKIQNSNIKKFDDQINKNKSMTFMGQTDCECNACLVSKKEKFNDTTEGKVYVMRTEDSLKVKYGVVGQYRYLGYKRKLYMKKDEYAVMGIVMLVEGKEAFYPLNDILYPVKVNKSYDPKNTYDAESLRTSEVTDNVQWLKSTALTVNCIQSSKNYRSNQAPYSRRYSYDDACYSLNQNVLSRVNCSQNLDNQSFIFPTNQCYARRKSCDCSDACLPEQNFYTAKDFSDSGLVLEHSCEFIMKRRESWV